MRAFVTLLAAISAIALTYGAAQSAEAETYSARLTPLNSSVAKTETKGQAKFSIEGDKLTITINVEDAPADIPHLQHFHGFKTGDKDAMCPTAEADANEDGVIDLIETEPMAGTTMVPFHDDPSV